MHFFQQSGTLHGGEPSAVAVGQQGDLVGGGHENLSVLVHRRLSFLREEIDVVGTVAKIAVLPEKCLRLLVVLLAGHDQQGHVRLRLVRDTLQVLDEALENVQLPCPAHVEHALGVLKAQP